MTREKNATLFYFAKKHWPLPVAIVSFLFVIAIVLFSAYRRIHYFGYALDDPYIHMAMAKNMSENGIWGVTRYEFSSSSSSPVWTLLLSMIYMITGPNDLIPLILNIIFAILLLIAIYWIYSSYKPVLPSYYKCFALLLFVFLTSLPGLAFVGLEHTLHALVTILFVYCAARELSRENHHIDRNTIAFLALAAFIVLIRYEGIFLVFIVFLLAMLRRRWLLSLELAAAASILPAVFGIISIANGSLWLPNSVLNKGNIPILDSFHSIISFLGYTTYQKLLLDPALASLIVVALLLFRIDKRKGFWDMGQLMIVMFIGVTCLHAVFATVENISFHFYLFRYVSYLVALGLFVLVTPVYEFFFNMGRSIRDLMPTYIAVSLIALILIIPLAQRGYNAIAQAERAMTNIYEQQYQLALFLQRYYQGTPVVLNDIGLINYHTDIKCLDMMGLGNVEVLKAMKDKNWNKNTIAQMSMNKGVKVALIYDSVFGNSVPLEWNRVGQWKISNNVVCGSETVSIYAVDPSETNRLIDNLSDFQNQLPKTVEQSGSYVP